ALVLLGVYVLATVLWIATLHGLMDVFHQPLGGDFIIFYGTSSLTLHGQALAAYDPAQLLAAQRAAVPGAPAGLLWCYPPPFQLLITPLALLPFAAAYAAWIAVSFTLYFALVRLISDHRMAVLLACAFPGFFVAAIQGQNGFLTTAALGFGLLLLDRRPWLAGAILGLLAYKPQFGVLLPLLLIGTGRWRSVAGAALSSIAFVALSTAAFGLGAWEAFLRELPDVSASLSNGLIPWSKIPSTYVALAWLGAPKAVAYAAHGAVALAVAAVTLVAWRRPGPLPLKAGLAVLATLCVTPYAFNYDLVMLAVPIGVTLEYGRRHPLPPGTLLALALAFVVPNAFLGIAKATHVQLMPVAILIVFAALARVLFSADDARPAGAYAPALAPA
ncbi:MAG: glycosyltransferase family 87 protein, partial [Phenylobacterium sp.]